MADKDASLHQFYDVAAVQDVKEGHSLMISVEGVSIALVRQGDCIRALGGRCPHKGAPLRGPIHCKTHLHGDVLVCPWHKAFFSVETGRVCEPIAFSALPTYPVEEREGRVWVSTVPASRAAPEPILCDKKVLIIGGGAAAASAVFTLREEGFSGKITIVGDEGTLPYDRTALSKGLFLGTPDNVRAPLLLEESFYGEQHIHRIHGHVVHCDVVSQTVTLEDQRKLSGDYLLIATGGKPAKPDVPGIDQDGVLTLHNQQDARRISEFVTSDQAVVLIGGGLTALETASALRQKGVGVTIVAPDPIPMEKQWGREVGSLLLQLHEDNSVAFIHDASIVQIYGESHVEGVELSDGMRLPCRYVFIATGAVPRHEFLKDDAFIAGPRGGILVDHAMRVAPNVYAAGDVTSFPHGDCIVRVEHWRHAQVQGRLAARSILGKEPHEIPTPWFWSQQFGKKIEYLGWGHSFDRVMIQGDIKGFDFLAVYIRKDKVVALVASGRARQMARAAADFDGFVQREIGTDLL